MSDQIPHLARRVLRVIYELQFQGRRQALGKRLVEDGPKVYVPAGADRMPIRFQSVPILVLLAEFYEQGLDYRSHPVTDLRAAIRYCERKDWIERYFVEGGEAEVNHGSVREVESAVGIYFRPDGVLVTSFWFLAEVDCIPPIYRALGPKQLREELQIGDMRHLHLSGIRVGPYPIYWAFRRLHKGQMVPDLAGPSMRLTLGYPAGLSGYPADLNYVITKEGIARIELDGVDNLAATPGAAKNEPSRVLPQMKLATARQTEIHIPDRARKASEQYRQAAEALDVSDPIDQEAYDQLATAMESSGEKADLPTFSTWQRNLREYRRLTGQQKNKPRAGREGSAGSLVRADQIEPEHLPTRIRPKSSDQ